MKNKNINKKTSITYITYIEIILMLLSIISFSNLISNSIKIVSAEDTNNQEDLYCCLEDNHGMTCQEYPASIIKDNCNSNSDIFQSPCSLIDKCKKGCCIDNENGICTPNSNEMQCSGDSVTLDSNNPTCSGISECKKGCCIIGTQKEFITEIQCENLASQYGKEYEFKDKLNEQDCRNLNTETNLGACVLEGGNCRLTTSDECSGNFHQGLLCSNPSLNTVCKKQAYTGCVDGKDEVYWFDSCGNRENIYDATKYIGTILSKEQSCNPDSSNEESTTCGNCNFEKGSICGIYDPQTDDKPEHGNFICKNLNCKFKLENTVYEKKNGESWCVYDAILGPVDFDFSEAPVGSSSYVYTCENGKIKNQSCEGYRGSVCFQYHDKSKNLNEAYCGENLGAVPYKITNDDEKKSCEENPFSFVYVLSVKDAYVNGNQSENYCLPKYKAGFDYSSNINNPSNTQPNSGDNSMPSTPNTENPSVSTETTSTETTDSSTQTPSGSDICSMADVVCTGSKNCYSPETMIKMNELCVAMGDCGAYVNYLGTFSGKGFTMNGKTFEELLENKTYKKSLLNEIKKYKENNQQVLSFKNLIKGQKVLNYYSNTVLNNNNQDATISSVQTSYGVNWKKSLLFGAGGAVIGFMVAGPAGAIVGGIIGFLFGIFKNKNSGGNNLSETNITVEFKCYPWQALSGGGDCERCNTENPPCTESKCNSLGQACVFHNENPEGSKCLSEVDYGKPPEISSGYDGDGNNPENLKITTINDGIQISPPDGECFPPFNKVTLKIKTNEPSICTYTTDNKNGNSPFGKNYLSQVHTIDFEMPSIEFFQQISGATTDSLTNLYKNLNFYITCKDNFGNSAKYHLKTCVEPGPDTNPPEIKKIQPENNGFVKIGTENQDITVWLNEPSNCSWSETDQDYIDMPHDETHQMKCKTGLADAIGDLWPCTTTLPIKNEENTFYIRCRDKPWLEDDDPKSIKMPNSYEYTLSQTPSNLEISSIEIEDQDGNTGPNFITNGESMLLDLHVTTEGGADDGNAKCKYLRNGIYFTFLNTGGTEHIQRGLGFSTGDYIINVSCKDKAGNEANDSVSFNVVVDNTGPIIVRAYKEDEQLKIITDEIAKCNYTSNGKDWNEMDNDYDFSKIHTIDWTDDKEYTIKCFDSFGTPGGEIDIKTLSGNSIEETSE